MPTLTADAGSFALSVFSTPWRMYAGTGALEANGQTAALGRELEVGTTTLALRLERLRFPITDGRGQATSQFQLWWQRQCEAIEAAYAALAEQVAAIQAAYDAAAQASSAASVASDAAVQAQVAVEEAQEVVDLLQSGDLSLPAITVGGKKFYNDDGVLA